MAPGAASRGKQGGAGAAKATTLLQPHQGSLSSVYTSGATAFGVPGVFRPLTTTVVVAGVASFVFQLFTASGGVFLATIGLVWSVYLVGSLIGKCGRVAFIDWVLEAVQLGDDTVDYYFFDTIYPKVHGRGARLLARSLYWIIRLAVFAIHFVFVSIYCLFAAAYSIFSWLGIFLVLGMMAFIMISLQSNPPQLLRTADSAVTLTRVGNNALATTLNTAGTCSNTFVHFYNVEVFWTVALGQIITTDLILPLASQSGEFGSTDFSPSVGCDAGLQLLGFCSDAGGISGRRLQARTTPSPVVFRTTSPTSSCNSGFFCGQVASIHADEFIQSFGLVMDFTANTMDFLAKIFYLAPLDLVLQIIRPIIQIIGNVITDSIGIVTCAIQTPLCTFRQGLQVVTNAGVDLINALGRLLGNALSFLDNPFFSIPNPLFTIPHDNSIQCSGSDAFSGVSCRCSADSQGGIFPGLDSCGSTGFTCSGPDANGVYTGYSVQNGVYTALASSTVKSQACNHVRRLLSTEGTLELAAYHAGHLQCVWSCIDGHEVWACPHVHAPKHQLRVLASPRCAEAEGQGRRGNFTTKNATLNHFRDHWGVHLPRDERRRLQVVSDDEFQARLKREQQARAKKPARTHQEMQAAVQAAIDARASRGGGSLQCDLKAPITGDLTAAGLWTHTMCVADVSGDLFQHLAASPDSPMRQTTQQWVQRVTTKFSLPPSRGRRLVERGDPQKNFGDEVYESTLRTWADLEWLASQKGMSPLEKASLLVGGGAGSASARRRSLQQGEGEYEGKGGETNMGAPSRAVLWRHAAQGVHEVALHLAKFADVEREIREKRRAMLTGGVFEAVGGRRSLQATGNNLGMFATQMPVGCQNLPYLCPDEITCVAEKAQCPPPQVHSLGNEVRWTVLQLELQAESVDIRAIAAETVSCWNGYVANPASNPYSLTNNIKGFSGGLQALEASGQFVYCWPMVAYFPWTQWELSEFDFSNWMNDQCTSNPSLGGCSCDQYYPNQDLFTWGADWFTTVPFFVYARIYNGMVAFWTLFTGAFTAGTIFDQMWSGFLGYFTWIPRWIVELWGNQGQGDGAVFCALFNTGPILYVAIYSLFFAVLFHAFHPAFAYVHEQVGELLWGIVKWCLMACFAPCDEDERAEYERGLDSSADFASEASRNFVHATGRFFTRRPKELDEAQVESFRQNRDRKRRLRSRWQEQGRGGEARAPPPRSPPSTPPPPARLEEKKPEGEQPQDEEQAGFRLLDETTGVRRRGAVGGAGTDVYQFETYRQFAS